MATNFVQQGKILSLTAGANGSSGDAVLIGNIFGVLQKDVVSGETAELGVEGVYTVPKKTGVTFAHGDAMYWDNTAKTVTKTSAVGLYRVGVAVSAEVSGATTAQVRLDGVSTLAV